MRIDPNPAFWVTVTVTQPGDGPGEGGKDSFRARFKVLTTDEFEAHDLSSGAGTKAFLDEVLLDVDEVEDEAGKPLAFGPELFRTLVGHPHVRAAIVRAWLEAIDRAARGN